MYVPCDIVLDLSTLLWRVWNHLHWLWLLLWAVITCNTTSNQNNFRQNYCINNTVYRVQVISWIFKYIYAVLYYSLQNSIKVILEAWVNTCFVFLSRVSPVSSLQDMTMFLFNWTIQVQVIEMIYFEFVLWLFSNQISPIVVMDFCGWVFEMIVPAYFFSYHWCNIFFQLTYFSFNDYENICTLSHHFHQIRYMNH